MSPRNPALKRRTDLLLDDDAGATAGSGKLFGLSADLPQLVELPMAQIRRNPDQPRRHFDPAEIDALAASIERHGLQNPVIVSRLGRSDYQLVGGERRLRAHEQLGRDTIFAIITRADPEEIAIIDNVLRVDLNAVELASALARLADSHGYTHEQLGAVIGRDQSDVTKILSILRLPAEVLESYLAAPERASRSVLIEIAAVDDPARQRALWQRVLDGATVRELRQAKREQATGEASAIAAAPEVGPEPRRVVAGRLRRIERELGELVLHRRSLDDGHRERLGVIRRQIDELLANSDTWDVP